MTCLSMVDHGQANPCGVGLAAIKVEPDPVEMAERYGPETTVLDWSKRLVCSACGSQWW
jgi:hypothetical protein